MDIYETKKYPILQICYSGNPEDSGKVACLHFSKFICVTTDISLIRKSVLVVTFKETCSWLLLQQI